MVVIVVREGESLWHDGDKDLGRLVCLTQAPKPNIIIDASWRRDWLCTIILRPNLNITRSCCRLQSGNESIVGALAIYRQHMS
jgi:hypothetical protein